MRQFGQLILRKKNEILINILKLLKMHQIRFMLRFNPQTPLGELTALPRP